MKILISELKVSDLLAVAVKLNYGRACLIPVAGTSERTGIDGVPGQQPIS
jgi:hypothetical protein